MGFLSRRLRWIILIFSAETHHIFCWVFLVYVLGYYGMTIWRCSRHVICAIGSLRVHCRCVVCMRLYTFSMLELESNGDGMEALGKAV